jgi:hypothetical protein
MIDFGSWVGTLATLDEPSTDGRVLALPFALRFEGPRPLYVAATDGSKALIGTVTEAGIVGASLIASGRIAVLDDDDERLAEIMVERMRTGEVVPGFDLFLTEAEANAETQSPPRLASGELGSVTTRPAHLASWPACRFEVEA